MAGWEFETAERLRATGWIPREEACELLGMTSDEMLDSDRIEGHQWGADGALWVLPAGGSRRRSAERGSRLDRAEGSGGGTRGQGAKRSKTITRTRTRTTREWMTVAEAAAFLAVHRNTVYRLASEGTVGSVKEGGRLRLQGEDVEARSQENWFAELEAHRERIRRPKMRPFRRDGAPLVSDDEFRLCEPYGYMAIAMEREREAEWRDLFGMNERDDSKREDWRDEGPGEKRALTVNQAAEILEISPMTVHGMAYRGTLTHIVRGRGPNRRSLFSPEQVEALSIERQNREAQRSKTPAEWAYDLRRPLIRTKIEAPPGDELIDVAEASAILGVRQQRLSDLVREGRLFGWQEFPGQRGSKLWLSRRQVTRYANDEERVERRNRRLGIGQKTDPDGEMSCREEFREWTGLDETDGREPRAVDIDHGEFFSTSQVCRELGLSRAAVTKLRRRGALIGYQLRWRKNKESAGRGWWFYRKEDVWGRRGEMRR